MIKKKTYFNWSSGKDAALALYYVLQDEQYEIAQFVTSVNSHYNRVSMHGIRKELVIKQAQSIGIPLTTIELPKNPDMNTYNKIMHNTIEKLKSEGYTHTVFGDIFLKDLRSYREKQLEKLNIKPYFPLWNKNTRELLNEFVDLGFKAKIICLNSHLMDASFLGRDLDHDFIKEHPNNIDPCGENGEFYTFCYDGPIFNNPISFVVGQKTYKEYASPKKGEKKIGFWFCDLI